MRRRALTAAAATAVLWLGAGNGAFAAPNTVTVSAPNGASGTLLVPDYVMTTPGCQEFPFTAVFTNVPENPPNYSTLGGSASVPGSNSSVLIAAQSEVSGTATVPSTFGFCLFSHPFGQYAMTARLFPNGGEAVVTTELLTFTIGPSEADLSVQARAGRSRTVVSIKATTNPPTGPLGVDGTVTVATRTPKRLGGTGRWVDRGQLSTDSFGAATSRLSSVPRGSSVRVALECRDGYCKDLSVTTTVR